MSTETTPRQYTAEEVRAQFLGHLRAMAHYWATCPIDRPELRESVRREGGEIPYRLNGLVFSILGTLDGASGGMPSFRVFPSCHEDDPAFRRAEGENWWPANDGDSGLDCEITTSMLHEEWHS